MPTSSWRSAAGCSVRGCLSNASAFRNPAIASARRRGHGARSGLRQGGDRGSGSRDGVTRRKARGDQVVGGVCPIRGRKGSRTSSTLVRYSVFQKEGLAIPRVADVPIGRGEAHTLRYLHLARLDALGGVND